MKQLRTLILLLICLLPLAPASAQNIIPGPDCCANIYCTSAWLGWSAALLEYTRERRRPEPEDQEIYRYLTQATVYIPRAYQTCSSIVPAWPNWRQKQRWVNNQIATLQSEVNHHMKRGLVYSRINSTYGQWSDELSGQSFNGQIINQVTCSTCYFKLGFDIAYATQAYRQAQEAWALADQTQGYLRAEYIRSAQRQMNLAVQHLRRATGVMRSFWAIQRRISFRLRCSGLVVFNLDQRLAAIVNRGINRSTLAINYREANAIHQQIGDLLLRDCVPDDDGGGGTPEECRNHHCPMCTGSVVLLGQAASPECQSCLDRKKAQIVRCIREGGGRSEKISTWVGTWAVRSHHRSGPARGGRYNSRLTVRITSSGSYVVWNNETLRCTITGNTLKFTGKHQSGGKMNWTFVQKEMY